MKIVYAILGFISLALGIIGIILPILPTTPFLLLTAFLFTKSSDRLNNWFKSTKIYEKHLKDFAENRSMRLSSKIKILALASSFLIFAFIMSKSIHARIAIIIVMILKYWYFFTKIETLKVDKESIKVEN